MRWIVDLLNFPITNLRSTQNPPQNFVVAGTAIVPSICQDLLYGDDLRTTTTAPRMLVNLSNVAFFTAPLIRAQLLNIARARALEQQIPLLIAANYGPAAFINASGIIERELPCGPCACRGGTQSVTQPVVTPAKRRISGNWRIVSF